MQISRTLCACALTTLSTLNYLHAEFLDVYFGTAGNGGIHHAVFNDSEGTLSAIDKVTDLDGAGFIVAHPTKPFLYSVAKLGERNDKGHVAAFEINEDKTLTKLNAQSAEGFNPCHISLDATGRTLMVANYSGGQAVASFQIKEDGALTGVQSMHSHAGSGAHPNRQKGPHPHSIFPNPTSNFAYAPDLGTDHIEIYNLDPSSARLLPAGNAEVPGGSKGPRHMKFSQDGRFAYVLLELSMEIATYAANVETGGLNYLETVSFMQDPTEIERLSCAEIRIHPNGNFVYSSTRDLDNRHRDTISVFARDAMSGRLKLIENKLARVSVPRNFNITPSGQWLIAGGQRSGDLAIFSINSNTGLLEPHGENITFDGSPICVEFVVR